MTDTASNAAGAGKPSAAGPARAKGFTPSAEQAAVLDAPIDGDMLVVAGAGSGKTFTMTHRIIELIDQHVPPERILGLTFTRKAAAELLSRVSAAVEDGVFKPTVNTYDAFFQTIVRQYGLLVGFDQNTQPLSDAGAMQLIAKVVGDHLDLLDACDMGAFSTVVKQVHALSGAIGGSMIGDGCLTMEQGIERIRQWDRAFEERVDAIIGDETVPESDSKIPSRPKGKKNIERKIREWEEKCAQILHQNELCHAGKLRSVAQRRDVLLALVEEYDRAKRRLNMAEFSDFTIAAFQLVSRFPSIGEEYRRRFSHVLLDEYQDTSTTQASLLAAIFHAGEEPGERSSVIAVGDPFQSIYAWRGASPGAFRIFQQDFGIDQSRRPYTLSMTRRNARIVLQAANSLTEPLRRAPRRASSSTMREVDVSPLNALPDKEDGTVGMLGYQTLGQEIDGVTRFVRHARASGKSVAVLFRSKKDMPVFRDAFERAGLRALIVGKSALLELPVVRDMFAMLHAVADRTDAAALMRLLATPRYAIGAEDLRALAGLAERLNTEYRYRALAQAGLVDPDAPRSTWAASVAEHRDKVANAVFLPDLLVRADLEDMLARSQALSERGADAALRAGAALRAVRQTIGRPLIETVRAAVAALDLDIDTVLAQAIDDPERPVQPALAHAPMEAVVDLVNTYVQEIAEGESPSLAGFMAWADELRDIPEEPQGVPDEPADVTLMSIHQSKGLEWDAVAVVQLCRRAFPSSTGSGLKVDPDEERPGKVRDDGSWEPPEYRETARTWLDDPEAVPVPMRVDAGILPRFPRAAAIGGGQTDDPIAALDALNDLDMLDDEVYGSARAVYGQSDDEQGDADLWGLTQSEEYGRRLHADERRLAYVALTRARDDVLLTFSADKSLSRNPNAGGKQAKPLDEENSASNFWTEVRDSLQHVPGAVRPCAGASEAAADAPEGSVPDLPVGYFVGDDAAAMEQAVVEAAWSEPVDEDDAQGSLPWPLGLSERVSAVLARSAKAVNDRIAAAAQDEQLLSAPAPADTLLSCAQLLCDDADLMGDIREQRDASVAASSDALADGPSGSSAAETFDDAVRRKAMRLTAGKRRNVTALQALSGSMTKQEARDYWRGIVRPIPRVASPAAASGIAFHAWAEQLLNARIDPARPDAPAALTDGSELGVWQQRLLDSPWAHRMPVWAERQLVVSIPELDRMIVNGKLDAVFLGPLDETVQPAQEAAASERPIRYTIVDWKTGRRPASKRDIERKLAQLDLYRLLLARIEGMPIDAIDAALYYVSEADPGKRMIPAERKSAEQILGQLIEEMPPEGSDDD